MLITVIGRGHSGTRAISHTLSQSGVYMGEPLNVSGDLIPPEEMYEACRVFAKYITFKGGMEWDFSKVMSMEPDPAFVRLVESYLSSVLNHEGENKGWKLPETTLVFPWIIKMFPEARFIHWVRDPRDCILGGHVTDDLNAFGVEYDKTDNLRRNRAISWFYQRELVRNTPAPTHQISVRFEDMIFSQSDVLRKLEKFLGFHLVQIPMRKDPVGRYKNDEEEHMFDFFAEDMRECGYEFE